MTKEEIAAALEECRFKIVSLDPCLMIQLLNWCRTPSTFYSLPVPEAIPDDAFYLSAHENHARRTVDAIICHHSFPPTLPGREIERIPIDLHQVFTRGELDCEHRRQITDAAVAAFDALLPDELQQLSAPSSDQITRRNIFLGVLDRALTESKS
jgi:hypothetical protein